MAADLGVGVGVAEVEVPGRVPIGAGERGDHHPAAVGIAPERQHDLVGGAGPAPDGVHDHVVHAGDDPGRFVVGRLEERGVLRADGGDLVGRGRLPDAARPSARLPSPLPSTFVCGSRNATAARGAARKQRRCAGARSLRAWEQTDPPRRASWSASSTSSPTSGSTSQVASRGTPWRSPSSTTPCAPRCTSAGCPAWARSSSRRRPPTNGSTSRSSRSSAARSESARPTVHDGTRTGCRAG